jgi:hypothetical protein
VVVNVAEVKEYVLLSVVLLTVRVFEEDSVLDVCVSVRVVAKVVVVLSVVLVAVVVVLSVVLVRVPMPRRISHVNSLRHQSRPPLNGAVWSNNLSTPHFDTVFLNMYRRSWILEPMCASGEFPGGTMMTNCARSVTVQPVILCPSNSPSRSASALLLLPAMRP